MKKPFLLLLLSAFYLSVTVSAQDTSKNKLIEDQFDDLASSWLEESGRLKTYQGVQQYCANKEYRQSVDATMQKIHWYDSLILSKLTDHDTYVKWNQKQEKKAVKDISEMENDFGIKQFHEHMRETCRFRNQIEKGDQEVSAELGVDAHDGQVLIFESLLRKYLNKIDKLVLRIDDHLHVLHVDR